MDLGVVDVNHIPDIGIMIRRLVRLFCVWNLGAPECRPYYVSNGKGLFIVTVKIACRSLYKGFGFTKF